MLLTDDQLATFRERGYVILKNVLSTDKMTPLLEAINCLRGESELPDSPSSKSWWENMHAVGTKRLQIVEPCELLAKPLVVSEYQHRDVRHLDSNRALRAAADSRSLPSMLADGR
jgi:hypothetical protein